MNIFIDQASYRISSEAYGSRADAGIAMCEKCVEIDNTIVRYRRILLSISDLITVDRTKELIADLNAQKAALHPEQGSKEPR